MIQGYRYSSIYISTECNFLVPDSPLTKTCACELINAIYCIVWSFFSVQQAKTCNFQKDRVTEQAVCTWVISKLNYWYIHEVCSMASHVKVYQDLPLLTFRRRHVGGEPGNKASPATVPEVRQNICEEFVEVPVEEPVVNQGECERVGEGRGYRSVSQTQSGKEGWTPVKKNLRVTSCRDWQWKGESDRWPAESWYTIIREIYQRLATMNNQTH